MNRLNSVSQVNKRQGLFSVLALEGENCWGAWVAQSFQRPTLDFGSGHDLVVCEFEPCIGLRADSAEPAWDSLSPSVCPSSTCALCFSK